MTKAIVLKKAKNAFAILGLIWFTLVLLHLIFPVGWMTVSEIVHNSLYHWWGALHGNRESQVWLLIFNAIPALFIFLVVFAGIGVQSVISRVIRKARAQSRPQNC